MVLKRKFSIFITMLVCLFALVGLTSCGGNSEPKTITLTTDNIEDYINLSVYPDIQYNYDKYQTYYFGGKAEATGIEGYSYENVTITIKVGFSYIGESRDVTFTVKCNVGGNGSGHAQNSKKVYDFQSDWMTKSAYYDIVSVTGTCTKE